MSKIFKGIRFRLTLVYSTLFGLVIFVFAYIMTNLYFQSGRQDFDASLINYAIDLSEHLISDSSGVRVALQVPAMERKKAFPFIINQTYYAVRTLAGDLILRSQKTFPFPDIPYDPTLPLEKDYTHRLVSFNHGADAYRSVNLKITTAKGAQYIVQVATLYNGLLDRERNHFWITGLMVPLLILGSSFFSFLIAGNALNPIKILTDTANNIAAQNLSRRIPVVDTGDEVEELSKTLNNLLERLDKSFQAQENFVANASHQLNTPLAIIKGELAVLETKERSPEDIKKFHQSLREEIDRLIELVKNMLLVSRVKSGLQSFVFHPQRLDDLLVTISSRLSQKAREKRITVRFNIDEELTPSDLEVMGEKQLLDSLFENILDNALKYSPEESTVCLDLKKIAGKTEVWIEDEGPGMDEKEFEQVISTRFQRGSSPIPGTGIGLSIANKIAAFHRARISYQKRLPRGSLFKIEFPPKEVG